MWLTSTIGVFNNMINHEESGLLKRSWFGICVWSAFLSPTWAVYSSAGNSFLMENIIAALLTHTCAQVKPFCDDDEAL